MACCFSAAQPKVQNEWCTTVAWTPAGKGGYVGLTVDIKVLEVDLSKGNQQTHQSFNMEFDFGRGLIGGGMSANLKPSGEFSITVSVGPGIGRFHSYSPSLMYETETKD